MPVRTFDGVDDRISLAIGSLGFAFGPGTLAAIVRASSDTGTIRTVFKAGSGAATRHDLQLKNTNALSLRLDAAIVDAPTITVTAADGWCLIVARKASGSVAPRFTRYKFSTGDVVHEDGSGPAINSGVPANNAYLGAAGSIAGSWFAGDIGIAGVWNTVLLDAEAESLKTQAAWTSLAPIARWELDQASVGTAVQDTVGSADQTAITGTSVTAGDIPWVPQSSSLGLLGVGR